jgi:hypothetical protein
MSPLTIIFHAMRAILLANATAANFGGLRLSSATSQGEAFLPSRFRTCEEESWLPTPDDTAIGKRLGCRVICSPYGWMRGHMKKLG